MAVLAFGLVASGCSRSTEAPPAATSATKAATSASPAAQAPAGGADLAALVPTPANTVTNKGPESIADNGVHFYFKVDGAPKEVMEAFKTDLEGKGWEVKTVSSSGHTGGGETLTGIRGDAYGIFEGGGYETTTYIDVCTWPAKPANPTCDHRSGR